MDRTARVGDRDWHACLKTYVHRLNRIETGEAGDLADLVADETFLARWSARARRICAAPRPLPIRAETRCRPLGIVGRDRNFRVRVRLAHRLVHEDGRVEERVEHEKLDFARRHGQWVIVRAEPEVPEKQEPAPAASAAAQTGSGTKPYMNRSLLLPRSPARRRGRMRGGADGGEAAGAEALRPLPYNREAAREYAETWWNKANPKYHHFRVDCTNFVSQCLFAGGLPMDYTGRRETGWWYEGYVGGRERWSFSWAVAHSLHAYLLGGSSPARGVRKADARELDIGDVICYDWDGDGRWQHTTIVTGRDPRGWPLVNAHTNNSRNRFWDYRDSYAWSEQTRYAFIHVPDGR